MTTENIEPEGDPDKVRNLMLRYCGKFLHLPFFVNYLINTFQVLIVHHLPQEYFINSIYKILFVHFSYCFFTKLRLGVLYILES